MTTIDLYRKHKAGEISREKFLYEVRRDNKLPFITNLTSYDDAVKILKNRGIVTEVDTKEAKKDEAVKAEVKAKKVTEPKLKELHIDQANPYEYRHGLAHELHQLDDYSAEALEKAKTTVLKNLAKDANFYSNLLNQQQSSFSFKTPESQDEKLMKKLDSGGRLPIKGITKEKANVKDNLGKKEEGTTKPKGVKIMSDKGVTGSSKTIKEGSEKNIKEYIGFGSLGSYPKIFYNVLYQKNLEGMGYDKNIDSLTFTKKYPKDTGSEITIKIGEPYKNKYSEKNEIILQVLWTEEIITKKYLGLKKDKSYDQQQILFKTFDLGEDFLKKYPSVSDREEVYEPIIKEMVTLIKKAEQDIDKLAAKKDKEVKEGSEDKHAKIKEALKKALKEADPKLKPVDDNIAKKETELANLYTQKANILKQPGSQT